MSEREGYKRSRKRKGRTQQTTQQQNHSKKGSDQRRRQLRPSFGNNQLRDQLENWKLNQQSTSNENQNQKAPEELNATPEESCQTP